MRRSRKYSGVLEADLLLATAKPSALSSSMHGYVWFSSLKQLDDDRVCIKQSFERVFTDYVTKP